MRVLILLCLQPKAGIKDDADACLIPYPEYLALQKATNATLFSFDDVKSSTHLLVRMARRLNFAWGLAMLGFVNRKQYEHIYCTGEDVAIPFGFLMKAARDFGRITAVIHNGGTPKRRVLLRLLKKRLFHKIICLSREQERILIEIIGFPKYKVQRLFQWLDHRFYDPEKAADKLDMAADDLEKNGYGLSVGQENRDYATLSQAVSGLPWQFRIVASGWSPDGLAMVGGVHNTGNATVEGSVLSYVELRQRYADARIVIVPLNNVTYAAGVTSICEAMSMGKPVIVSASPGVADYVQNGVSGFTVPIGDADALRKAIVTLWNDDELRHRMGAHNRKWVMEEFSTWFFAERVADIMGLKANDVSRPE